MDTFNPFQANVPCLYTLKTSQNLWFSDVFRGYGNGALAWNGLSIAINIATGSIDQ